MKKSLTLLLVIVAVIALFLLVGSFTSSRWQLASIVDPSQVVLDMQFEGNYNDGSGRGE